MDKESSIVTGAGNLNQQKMKVLCRNNPLRLARSGTTKSVKLGQGQSYAVLPAVLSKEVLGEATEEFLPVDMDQ